MLSEAAAGTVTGGAGSARVASPSGDQQGAGIQASPVTEAVGNQASPVTAAAAAAEVTAERLAAAGAAARQVTEKGTQVAVVAQAGG